MLGLMLSAWNMASISSDATSHTTDRAAVSMTFAIIAECLSMLSLQPLAWALVLPGIGSLMFMCLYRAFLHVKDNKTALSIDGGVVFSSIT
jgi:hypothetical protein